MRVALKELPILWQRLVIQGKTCPRCADTGQAILRTIERLKEDLKPLGMAPVLETRVLNQTEFHGRPIESNRIWIAGKPLEEWLDGKTRSSACCNECGDDECRTLEVDGKTYEAVPEELLVKAALIAAKQINADSTKSLYRRKFK